MAAAANNSLRSALRRMELEKNGILRDNLMTLLNMKVKSSDGADDNVCAVTEKPASLICRRNRLPNVFLFCLASP